MADLKFSALTDVGSALADADELPLVDVSDTTMAATGTTKVVTAANLKSYVNTPTVKSLSSLQSTSSTTPVEVTGLTTTTPLGTYLFQYFIIYQSTATGTGVKFSVNHSGTANPMVYNIRFCDVSAAAATGAATQAGVLSTAQVMSCFSARVKTVNGTGVTVSVDTANADMLMIVEGSTIVTAAGDLQLYFGAETATAVSVRVGSSLILYKGG